MQLVISTLFLSILMNLLLIFVQKCTKETEILKEFCERSFAKTKNINFEGKEIQYRVKSLKKPEIRGIKFISQRIPKVM